MLSEKFNYRQRSALHEEIISSFRLRAHKRRQEEAGGKRAASHYKINNPIVALSANSGSGKSSVLVHFGFSSEYISYWQSRQDDSIGALRVSPEPPLLRLLTFNSAMGYTTGCEALGLRIIYVAVCHLFNKATTIPWDDFYERFEHLKGLEGAQALHLLRNCSAPIG